MRRRRRRRQTRVVPFAPAPHPGSETERGGTRGERRRGREHFFWFFCFGFLALVLLVCEERQGRVSVSRTTNDRGYASSSDLGSADVRYQCPGDVPHSALLFSTVLNHSTEPSGHMSPLKPKLLPKLQRSDPTLGGAHAIVSNTIVVHSDTNRHRIPHHAAPSTVCWRVTSTCIPIGARRSATSHLLQKHDVILIAHTCNKINVPENHHRERHERHRPPGQVGDPLVTPDRRRRLEPITGAERGEHQCERVR